MWRSLRHTLLGSLAALGHTQVIRDDPSEPASRWSRKTHSSELHFGFANCGAGALGELEMEVCFHRTLLFSSPGAKVDGIGRNAHTRSYTGCRSLQTTHTAPCVCICLIDAKQNEASPVILQCPTTLLPAETYIPVHTAYFGGWQPQNSEPSGVYQPSDLCTPHFSLLQFFPGTYASLSFFSLSKPEHQHCCFWHLHIPRKATLEFCQMKTASNNKVSKKVSSGEW